MADRKGGFMPRFLICKLERMDTQWDSARVLIQILFYEGDEIWDACAGGMIAELCLN